MPKLHLDTDVGGDIDDLCALAMVLNWPDVELLAVTTNSDDQGRRAGYTRYALGLAGRADIAVAAGADVELGCYRVRPGFPDESSYWPEPIPPAPNPLDHALDLLERSIEQGAIIAAIGAYTNLALLEQRSPGILGQANLYLMGGSVFPPRAGFPAWGNDQDWNIQVDVQSAYSVFQHASPTLIPLSVTVETALRRASLPALRQAGPLAQLIARQAEAFAKESNYE
ncbi:MAG: nucleoside hydrolase, partial [Roseiflexaceae bacterium]